MTKKNIYGANQPFSWIFSLNKLWNISSKIIVLTILKMMLQKFLLGTWLPTNGNDFCDFLFASLDDTVLSNSVV